MLSSILESAKKAYEDQLDQQLAQIAAEAQKQAAQIEQERAEVRAWLCTIMPEALVGCVDLAEYSHQAASRNSSKDDRQGVWLTIFLPDAFPIHFDVYRNGAGLFRLVNEPYISRDELLRFAVPESAQVKREEGQSYISYSNWTRRNHADWQTAVGQALALWAEHGERLTAELNVPVIEPEQEPAPAPKPKTTEERIADALEHIASALDNLAMAQAHFD